MMLVTEIFAAIAAKTSVEVLPLLQIVKPEIVGVNFQAGHRLEIAQTLKLWGNGSQSAAKFPLIGLILDEPETYGAVGGIVDVQAQIIIATLTQENWKYETRKEQTLKPILYPVYEEFMRQIFYCGRFMNARSPSLTKIDRPLWGQAGANGNTGNFFDDKVDIIEIQNLKLKLDTYRCLEFKTSFNN